MIAYYNQMIIDYSDCTIKNKNAFGGLFLNSPFYRE